MSSPRSFVILSLICVATAPIASGIPGHEPAAWWDFSQPTDPWKQVNGNATLMQYNLSHPVRLETDEHGITAAVFGRNRLSTPRSSVPALAAISGKNATVTVIAWIRLDHQLGGGAFVGGLWEEYDAARQYALFLDGTGGCPTRDGVVAHISAEGGPSPGKQYCESRACGATVLDTNVWHCIANTYDGVAIKAFVNGTLDSKDNSDHNNPFMYPDPPQFPNGGIYQPSDGQPGPDFALGANFIHIGGGTGTPVLGNIFHGRIHAFSVHSEALDAKIITTICDTQFRRAQQRGRDAV